MKNKLLLLLTILVLCFLSSCASIPREASELSHELGNRISAIEKSNLNLLHKFFNLKRNELDKLIEEEWVPEFAKQVFSNPKISSTWDIIVSENNKEDRLIFLVTLGPKLQAKINDKRLELIKPLDDLERLLEIQIRNEYTQARSINNTITSFLVSASKVVENRNRFLEKIGLTNDKIDQTIDKTDNAINFLLESAINVQDKTIVVEEYLKMIKTIKSSI